MPDQDTPPIPPAQSAYQQTSPPPVICCPPPPRRRSIIWPVLRFIVFAALVLIIIGAIMSIFAPSGFQEHPYAGTNRGQRIALIPLDDIIDMDAAARLRDMLRRAQEDQSVRGAILVVNSPGGQVAPSDMINRYLRDFTKPLYACIEQVGASGAYWSAVAADHIYAQTNAIVGSIGVIYLNFIIVDALEERLGVQPLLLTSTRALHKDRGSMFRPPTEEDIAAITDDLDTIHQRFVKVVADGRGLDEDQAWSVAEGDVYDGLEALELGLIDEVGFLEDAINRMTVQLNLTDPAVFHYRPTPTVRDLLSVRRQDPLDIAHIRRSLSQFTGALALWPGGR